MEYIIGHLEITNSVNKQKDHEWVIFTGPDYELLHLGWESERKDQMDEWNHRTPGANSTRYYSFTTYQLDDILGQPLKKLKGMTLKDFISIVKLSEEIAVI